MNSFVGLFVVLVVGCALGIVVSCCDLAWAAARNPRDPSEPYGRRLWTELRFVFSLERSEKPLYGPLLPPTPHATGSPGSLERAGSPGSAGSRAGSNRSEMGSLGEDVTEEGSRERTPRLRARSSARRSSMHAASLRLARHTTPRPN